MAVVAVVAAEAVGQVVVAAVVGQAVELVGQVVAEPQW